MRYDMKTKKTNQEMFIETIIKLDKNACKHNSAYMAHAVLHAIQLIPREQIALAAESNTGESILPEGEFFAVWTSSHQMLFLPTDKQSFNTAAEKCGIHLTTDMKGTLIYPLGSAAKMGTDFANCEVPVFTSVVPQKYAKQHNVTDQTSTVQSVPLFSMYTEEMWKIMANTFLKSAISSFSSSDFFYNSSTGAVITIRTAFMMLAMPIKINY